MKTSKALNYNFKAIIYLFCIFLAFPYSTFSQAKLIQVEQEEKPGRQNYFGSSVAMDGKYAVVTGTHSQNPESYNGGMAYVYELNNGKWQLRSKLYPDVSYSQDRFGQNACSIDGKTILIGDWKNQKNPNGAAHIFQLEGDTSWQYVSLLQPKDTIGVESFGRTVALEEDIAVVASYNEVFIFQPNAEGRWKQTAVLREKDFNTEGFGNYLKVTEGELYISAAWEDKDTLENLGAVYHFKQQLGKWKLAQKINPLPKYYQNRLEFGNAVAVNKETLFIGARRMNIGSIPGPGTVSVYKKVNGKWEFNQILYNENFKYRVYGFGKDIQLTEDYLFVLEEQGEEHNTTTFIYEQKGDNFNLVDTIQGNQESGKNFIAASGNNFLYGNGGNDFCDDFRGGCGKAYFYSVKTPQGPSTPENSISSAAEYGFSTSKIKALQKKFNGSDIQFDYINEDLVYKMRNKETGLWGMFQDDRELIPMEYDSIKFFGFNHPFTIVGKDGLLGIHTSSWGEIGQLSVSCRFDEFKIYRHEGKYWLAGKRNGKWRWVNWYNGYESSSEKEYHQELPVYTNWKPGRY